MIFTKRFLKKQGAMTMHAGRIRMTTCLGLIAASLSGCASGSGNRASRTPPAESRVEDDMEETAPRRTSMPGIMQAKLAHAQAVLEGLATSNFQQIELNARDLKEISERSEWIVQDSAAYYSLSEDFRTVLDATIADSHRRDLNAVTDDYAKLTNSCVACHTFMRNERATKDMPGKISLR